MILANYDYDLFFDTETAFDEPPEYSTRDSFRQFNVSNNETCFIPQYIDKMYRSLIQFTEHTNSGENVKQTLPCKLQSTHLQRNDNYMQKQLCISEIHMSPNFLSRNAHNNIYDPCYYGNSDFRPVEDCYCDLKGTLLTNETMHCLCKLRVYLEKADSNIPRLSEVYYRKYCEKHKVEHQANKNVSISNCTVEDIIYPFEQIYFNFTNSVEKGAPSIIATINEKTTLDTNNKTTTGGVINTTSTTNFTSKKSRSNQPKVQYPSIPSKIHIIPYYLAIADLLSIHSEPNKKIYTPYTAMFSLNQELLMMQEAFKEYNSASKTMYEVFSTNHIQFLLLVLFHLLIYFGLLKKEFIHTTKKKTSKDRRRAL